MADDVGVAASSIVARVRAFRQLFVVGRIGGWE
jgi:hypothetical protein